MLHWTCSESGPEGAIEATKMLGVRERPPEVKRHHRKPWLDEVQAPPAEQDWRVCDLNQMSVIIAPSRGPIGRWLAKLLKAALKALVWVMDAMCDGLCPWVKKE